MLTNQALRDLSLARVVKSRRVWIFIIVLSLHFAQLITEQPYRDKRVSALVTLNGLSRDFFSGRPATCALDPIYPITWKAQPGKQVRKWKEVKYGISSSTLHTFAKA